MGRGNLYNQLTGQNKQQYRTQLIQQHNHNITNYSSNSNILQEAASKGFGLNLNDFVKFANMLKGKDANGIVQELLDSGQMSQEQFESLKSKAQGFIGLAKLLH